MKTGTGRIRLRSIVVLIGIAVAIDGVAPSAFDVLDASGADAAAVVSPGETNTNAGAGSIAPAAERLNLDTNAGRFAGSEIDTNAIVAALAASQTEMMQSTRQLLDALQERIETQVARHAEAVTSALGQIEPALDRIRQQQEQSASNANRTFLIAAGLFAVAGFLGLGFLTMASVRAMGRFTDVAVVASNRKQLPGSDAGTTGAPAPPDGFKPMVSGTVEQASARFQGALEQLERRIRELEHTSHPPAGAIPQRTPAPSPVVAISPAASTSTGTASPASAGSAPETNGRNGPGETSILAQAAAAAAAAAGMVKETSVLSTSPGIDAQLAEGQALLNTNQATEALECLERALAEAPDNTDALLRKGMALEKLQEWESALACYDRVIILDESLTVAHLYRGGVCNRLERHREALESYEKALHSERQRAPVNQPVMP